MRSRHRRCCWRTAGWRGSRGSSGIGWDEIHARITANQLAARAALADLDGVGVITPPGPQAGLVVFAPGGARARGGVLGSARGTGVCLRWLVAPPALRASLGFFTSESDLDSLTGRRPSPAVLIRSESVNQKFVIEGGRPLAGTVVPAGNKNAALPILAACLLTDEEVILDNVPQIVDVHTMVALLDDIGVSVREDGPNTLVLRADNIRQTSIDPELSGRLRASLLVAGPLLARCGKVETALPGGDFIGRRRVDTHMLAFRSLGAEVDSGRSYVISAPSRAARRRHLPR